MNKSLIIALAFVSVVVLWILSVALTYRVRSSSESKTQEIIETLDRPFDVAGWDSTGISLRDGRHVKLPGLTSLPSKSQLLEEVTKRGVEIRENRVYGLVPVYSTCANDPVRKHIARVDIAYLLSFAEEGEPKDPLLDKCMPHRTFIFNPKGGITAETYVSLLYWEHVKKNKDASASE